MPDASLPFDTEQLLAQAAWVRALARRLVRDEARASDLEQEVWMAVLESPPKTTTNVRGWLAAVVRNQLRQSARAESRRLRREERVARGEALEATHDLVARASVQRDLVDRVLTLDEPYRTVILLRYFEDLDPAAIAERLDVKPATVRTQLSRAHELLRQKLSKEYGDGRSWCLTLLPLARLEVPAHSNSTAVHPGRFASMQSKLVLGLSVVCVAILGGAGLRRLASPGESAPREAATVGDAAARPSSPPLDLGAQRDANAERSALGATERATNAPAAAVQATDDEALSGFVLDLDGNALADVEVTCLRLLSTTVTADGDRFELTESLPGLSPARTDAHGRFEFARVPERATVSLALTDRLALGHGRRVRDLERVELVAPAIDVSGRVLGPDGAPLADVELEFCFSIDALATLPCLFREFDPANLPRTRSSASGRYELPRVVGGGHGVLVAKHAQLGRLVMNAPSASTSSFDLVYGAPTAVDRVVRGVVANAANAPLAGATVELGALSTRSTSSGSFELVVKSSAVARDDGLALLATKSGSLPALVQGFGAQLAVRDPQELVMLALGGPTLAISGRVLLDDGSPAGGCEVRVRDLTCLPGLKGSLERRCGMLATESDDTGRFRVLGLSARPYRLQVVRTRDGANLESAPIEAGASEIELRFPRDAGRAQLAGRLFDAVGQPIFSADVGLGVEVQEDGEKGYSVSRHALTERDGSFSFVGAPRERCVLHVRVGDEHVAFLPVPSALPDTGNEFRLPCKVRFVIEARANESADRCVLRDASGHTAALSILGHDGVATVDGELLLANAHDVVLQTTQDAVELVLFAGAQELRRVSLQLERDQITRVEL